MHSYNKLRLLFVLYNKYGPFISATAAAGRRASPAVDRAEPGGEARQKGPGTYPGMQKFQPHHNRAVHLHSVDSYWFWAKSCSQKKNCCCPKKGNLFFPFPILDSFYLQPSHLNSNTDWVFFFANQCLCQILEKLFIAKIKILWDKNTFSFFQKIEINLTLILHVFLLHSVSLKCDGFGG